MGLRLLSAPASMLPPRRMFRWLHSPSLSNLTMFNETHVLNRTDMLTQMKTPTASRGMVFIFLFTFAMSLSAQWSPMQPLSGKGAVGSPGGTHPIIANGNTLHFVWMSGGRLHYRRSSDAGVTWGHAKEIVSSGKAQYPCSLEISASTLHLFWPDSREGTWEVFHKQSDDEGKTWGHDTQVTSHANLFRMGTAVSGSSLQVVWGGSNRTGGQGDDGPIFYKRSTDG